MKKLVLFCFFLYSSMSCYAGRIVVLDRSNDERICYQDSVLTLPLVAEKSISLPLIDSCICIVEKELYEEGVFYICTYKSYKNEGVIIIVDGALIDFPADKYSIYQQIIVGDRQIFHGQCDSGFWRKDIWKSSTIKLYYDYAKEPKELDLIFNHAVISSKIDE